MNDYGIYTRRERISNHQSTAATHLNRLYSNPSQHTKIPNSQNYDYNSPSPPLLLPSPPPSSPPLPRLPTRNQLIPPLPTRRIPKPIAPPPPSTINSATFFHGILALPPPCPALANFPTALRSSLTSPSCHSGRRTRSSLLFVRVRYRPRKVLSASLKPPARRISRYDIPASLEAIRNSSRGSVRGGGAGLGALGAEGAGDLVAVVGEVWGSQLSCVVRGGGGDVPSSDGWVRCVS